MISIKKFIFNPLQVNCYVLYDESKECIIVDASFYEVYEKNMLSTFLKETGLKPIMICSTHGHVDHILGNNYAVNELKAKFAIHNDDIYLVKNVVEYGTVFGLNVEKPPMPDILLEEGKDIKFGNSSLQILHVPGHTPGSVAYYSKEQNFVIVGDVLFKGSIGRTDLPKGNFDTLINSISNKLFLLNDECVVHTGHGEETSISFEKQFNPFF